MNYAQNSSNPGLQRCSISNLSPSINNAVIVGIIIGNQTPRKLTKSGENKERGVWNFTLRDSIVDYINVTCWAEGNEVLNLYDKYHTGDIVEVIKPRIVIRQIGDFKEQYYPMVTSPFHLIINDASSLSRHETQNCEQYVALLHRPTKPIAGFINLIDIHNSKGNIENLVDLLGAIRTVGSTRIITTKSGSEKQVRDIIIFDHTHSSLQITLWDSEMIARASSWKPRMTILFMTDMRIQWSVFQNSVVASLSMRTIITENPTSTEAEKLRQYARSAPLEPFAIMDTISCTILSNPLSIQNVMSIKQVFDKIEIILKNKSIRSDDNQFTALLYAIVTSFDLDGFSPITGMRCNNCKSIVKNGICLNEFCSSQAEDEISSVVQAFDLRMMLSDQTGSLEARLFGKVAENVLDCTVNEFLKYSEDQKSKIKWKYLLERCAVRIMVVSVNGRAPLISVVHCVLASPIEVASRLPFY